MSMKLPATRDPGGPEQGWLEPPEGAAYGQYGEAGAYGAEAGLDIKRYVAALWRFKWLIIAVTVLGTAAAVGATRLMKPEYEAQATIWIESSGQPGSGGGGGPIQQSELLTDFAWVELLRSYRVMDSVAVKFQLYMQVSPVDSAVLADFRLERRFLPGRYRFTVDQSGRAYTLTGPRDEVVDRGELGDSVGLDLGFAWAPPAEKLWPGRRIDFTVGSPRDAANELIRTLQARMDRNGNFLRLALRGEVPERTATIINAVADRFIEVAAEMKGAKLTELAEKLDEQLQAALSNLQQAETSLERFRVNTITLPSEPASPVNPGLQSTTSPAVANFLRLKGDLDQLRRDREAITEILDQAADSGLSLERLEIIPSVNAATDLQVSLGELISKRADLRALNATLTDQHPTVQRARQEIADLERNTIPRLARRLIADLGAREREIQRLIASASGQLTEIPPRTIEEARLQRDVAIRAQLYSTLQARYENARLAAVSTIPDVRLLDAAIPPRQPVNQKEKPRLIFLAFMGSLGLAVAGVIALDHLDPKLKYPQQVSQDLGLPILGTVPHVKSREGRGVLGNTSQVVESFRLIRLNLSHAYGAAGPVVVAITSPAGEEGKSFVSANLGLAFSDLGRRTLVIDADVRRGHLHHLLGGSRKPGLTDFLMGRISWSQLVRPTAYRNLDRISSGTRRQDGPELLQSSVMATLMAELRTIYDVIIVDTPPIGAGADALALGTLTGNFVIVVRTGSTDREMTEAKLDMLERLPVRILGAVLNDVPESGPYGAYYYAYSYLPGYEAVDEEESTDEVDLIESVAASGVAGDGNPEEGSSPSLSYGSVDDSEPRASSHPSEASSEQLAMRVVDGALEGEGVEDRTNGPRPNREGDPQRELHRQHQRRSQVRQWK